MDKLILTEKIRDICILTINRPEKRNALSPELVELFELQLDQIEADQQIRGLIITGSGRAFCAGADLAYLKQLSHFTDKENLEDSLKLASVFHKLYTLPKITVALLNGAALAGGCGLALCCDYIFADEENARLGFTEVRIGFIPAIVMNFLIRRIRLYDALHLAIEGTVLNAREAFELGIVHKCLSVDKLRQESLSFLENLLTQNSFYAMMSTKKLFQDLLEKFLSEGLQLAGKVNAESRKSEDCQKGLDRFLNKKPQQWKD